MVSIGRSGATEGRALTRDKLVGKIPTMTATADNKEKGSID